jgi:phytoene synthase
MTELDPDRQLALAYVPASRRAAVEALWRLDATLGAVLATGTDPMISRIRLAWWREALEKLDRAPAPAEPVLQALAIHVLPAGVTGAELAAMEEGWAAIVPGEVLTGEALGTYATARGGRLFALSARLLAGEAVAAGEGGRLWALVDLARHITDKSERQAVLAAAGSAVRPGRWPKRLRPIGMLAALARRDLARGPERHGSPARMLRMMAHRLTGR